MNKILLTVVLAGNLFGVSVLAAEPGTPPGPHSMSVQDKDKQLRAMQENMLKMHEQMHKIMDAKNPQDRERLMQEQRDMMQKHMETMRAGMMPPDAGMHGSKDRAPNAPQH